MTGAQQRLVFGRDRDPGVIEEAMERTRSGTPTSNPCVAAFGPGPDGVTCSGCAHLFAWGDTAGRYLKCDMRRTTRGSATDHRAGWPACAKYEERS